MRRLEKAESEIKWLNLILEQVKNNGQLNYAELEKRLDGLERRQ
jgi:hypothetical protein